MSEKKKRIREKVGQVFQVPLGDGTFGYGQVATLGSMVFFNYRDEGVNFNLEKIIQQPILFKSTVDSYAIKDGVWPVLGILPVDPSWQVEETPFTYDALKKLILFGKVVLVRFQQPQKKFIILNALPLGGQNMWSDVYVIILQIGQTIPSKISVTAIIPTLNEILRSFMLNMAMNTNYLLQKIIDL